MKALLLAAGFGTRLRPITEKIPKCLVPIKGKPLLGIWLEQLIKYKIKSSLINTHYLHHKVDEYVASSSYKNFATTVYEKNLKGTAGTVWANRKWLGNQPFMLVHADNYCICDLGEFIKSHISRPKGSLVTMMTFTTRTPETCGILEITDTGIVENMHEKVKDPPGNIANAAVYIVEPEIFDLPCFDLHAPADFSTEVLPLLMGKVNTWHNHNLHEDIGTIESYKYVNNS